MDAVLPSFVLLMQPFQSAMTTPTFCNLLTVVYGWVMSRRRAVTGALSADLAAGLDVPRHRSAYHRVFAAGAWSLDAVGLALLRVVAGMAAGNIFLVVDDTLCRRKGPRVFGAGMHYDPLATGRKWSNAGKSVKSRGHCWVTLGVVLSLPFRPKHFYCVPVLFRLYLNRKSSDRHKLDYQFKTQLARELIGLACGALPARRLHVLCDSGYTTGEVLNELPSNCELTGRWVNGAALYDPAPPRTGQTKGRPRVRGKRMAGPAQLLESRCRRLEFDSFGLRGAYRIASCLACVYAVPKRLLNIVATEPLTKSGRRKADRRAVLISTVIDATAEQVMIWYATRWTIEIAFRDAKQHLGMEQLFNWSEKAARRTAPTLMLLLYGLVTLWFARHGRDNVGQTPAEGVPSFAQMLATLRDRLARAAVLKDPPMNRVDQKSVESLLALLRLAV